MPTTHSTVSGRPAMLGASSPALVAVYSLLTFGVYLPLWYLARLQKLNGLASPAKVNGRLLYLLLGLYLVNASGVLSFVGGSDIQSALTLSSMGQVLTLVTSLILLGLRLRVRGILLDQYGPRFSAQPISSWIATVLLGEIYLQAKMNRLPAPAQAPTAPPVARAVHLSAP